MAKIEGKAEKQHLFSAIAMAESLTVQFTVKV
jgi:hypothetical protein